MSDSDDTEVLLLIPPNLFNVPSSDSDDCSDFSGSRKNKSSAVSELIDHMQSLESRIFAIELKDTSSKSLDLSRNLSEESIMNCRQTLPKTKFSVSPKSNMQKTPTKYSQCLSLPSTPNIHHLNSSSETHHTVKSYNGQNNTLNFNVWNKHDNLKSFSENTSLNKSCLHVGSRSAKKESFSKLFPSLKVCENSTYSKSSSSLPVLNSSSMSANHLNFDSKSNRDMSMSEVEGFLRGLESTDSTKNDGYFKKPYDKNYYLLERDNHDKRKMLEQHKMKFNSNGYSTLHEPTYFQSGSERRQDITQHNDTSFSSFDTDKFMADFKAPSHHELSDSKISLNFDGVEKFTITHQKEISPQVNGTNSQNYISGNTESHSYLPNHTDLQSLQSYMPNHSDLTLDNKTDNPPPYIDPNFMSQFGDEFTKSQTILSTVPEVGQSPITSSKSCPSIFKAPSVVSVANPADRSSKKPDSSSIVNSNINLLDQTPINTVNNSEVQTQRHQRILSLSDIWNPNSSKSVEENLRIKLEEERFKREHCEQLIQDLQKKLLEQQEKVAVALRVDNEKNYLISQFQVQWKKKNQKLSELESERDNLQKVLKSVSEKHQLETADFQDQIKKQKEEISKALNLASGYKEKSDSLVKEKLDILENHAVELQGYKSLVQQAESRYEDMKVQCQKLLEKNQKTEEALKAAQQDLNKELLKSSEVRSEYAAIHKAVNTCETELTILRQEKENLHLKLKEEKNRNNILEQGKASYITALEEAKKAEKLAKDEAKILTEQQDKLRTELREVYQKQVEEVVKAKLKDFQTQLDSAELNFQNEIETKNRAIAECAARKIKNIVDKHQLEISLLEEKHKEEKRLYEIKVAQAVQKAGLLESQLNSYRKSKSKLVEQLHSMLQRQWQQALLIITGNNGENISTFPKIDMDKFFELPNEPKLDLNPNHGELLNFEPMKLETPKSSKKIQNLQKQETTNESLATLTSQEDTPLSSRKEYKSDLKKYIKMILDMQQSKTTESKPKFFNTSPPTSLKENFGKQLLSKEMNSSVDGSSTWRHESELSVLEPGDYISIPQKFNTKIDHQKPPWK